MAEYRYNPPTESHALIKQAENKKQKLMNKAQISTDLGKKQCNNLHIA